MYTLLVGLGDYVRAGQGRAGLNCLPIVEAANNPTAEQIHSHQLTCFFTTRFFTPSIAKEDAWLISLLNMLTVLVPPPLYCEATADILLYVLRKTCVT